MGLAVLVIFHFLLQPSKKYEKDLSINYVWL